MVAGCLAAGCDGARSGGAEAVTRATTPGGWERVTYDVPPEGVEGELSLDLELGSLEGGEGEVYFGDIRGIEIDAEGELLILDYQASEIHAFDFEGNHLGLRHGSGEGPREVAEANGLFVDDGGDLWINDHGKMRLTRIRTDGEVATYAFPLPRYGYLWSGVVGSDGRFWETFTYRDPDQTRPDPGYVESTSSVGVLAVDPASGARDSLPIGEATSRGIALERGFAGVPFAPARLQALDPDGYLWTMASSDTYHLTRIELATGDTLVEVDLPVRGPVVEPAERRAEIERVEEFMERAGRTSVDWDDVLPERKPAAYQISVDADGNAWVLRQREADARWVADVVAPDGRWLRTWVLPFEPLRYYVPVIRDGWFFTVRTGEFEEPYVVGSQVHAR